MIRFRAENHKYESVIPDGRQWTSVTTVLKRFYESFDESIADRNSCDPKSKWYQIPPDRIREIWKNEAKRATDLGTWYHKKMEDQELTAINCCPVHGEWKYAGPQQLRDGVHPEIMLYHPEYNVCGQSDKVVVKNGVVDIIDYKSNKEIKTRGFRGKKLLYPVEHLEDCDLVKYNLQLSIYMFMILSHNKNLKCGKLQIIHVSFEIEGYDQYGYPLCRRDKNGEPIIDKTIPIEMPYLEKEVITMMNCIKNDNR